MTTIFLRFVDRTEAASTLAAVLNHDAPSEALERTPTTCGITMSHRYDVCILEDHGCISDDGAFLVNVRWHGPEEDAPDFGAFTVHPSTPACEFAS